MHVLELTRVHETNSSVSTTDQPSFAPRDLPTRPSGRTPWRVLEPGPDAVGARPGDARQRCPRCAACAIALVQRATDELVHRLSGIQHLCRNFDSANGNDRGDRVGRALKPGPPCRDRARAGVLRWPGIQWGLGLAVREDRGGAPMAGSTGDYFWPGAFATYWWADPKEQLVVVSMMQSPLGRHYAQLVRAPSIRRSWSSLGVGHQRCLRPARSRDTACIPSPAPPSGPRRVPLTGEGFNCSAAASSSARLLVLPTPNCRNGYSGIPQRVCHAFSAHSFTSPG
jgi:hypothetical protein